MTKKRHTASRMLLALIALTLVSFCFLGSTFARYTSTGTGTATTQVAEWSITGAEDFESASAEIDFQQLSPSAAPYASAERTHSTGKVKVAAITNTGDVNAKVWFTASAVPTITGAEEIVWERELTTLTAIRLPKLRCRVCSASYSIIALQRIPLNPQLQHYLGTRPML